MRGEGQSVEGVDPEQLLKKHNEYRIQIDRQLVKSQSTKDEGWRLVQDGDFMSQEVKETQEGCFVNQVNQDWP